MISETLKEYYESSITNEIISQVAVEPNDEDECTSSYLDFDNVAENKPGEISSISLSYRKDTVKLDKYTTISSMGNEIEKDFLDAICRYTLSEMFILGEQSKEKSNFDHPAFKEPIVGEAGEYQDQEYMKDYLHGLKD